MKCHFQAPPSVKPLQEVLEAAQEHPLCTTVLSDAEAGGGEPQEASLAYPLLPVTLVCPLCASLTGLSFPICKVRVWTR